MVVIQDRHQHNPEHLEVQVVEVDHITYPHIHQEQILEELEIHHQ